MDRLQINYKEETRPIESVAVRQSRVGYVHLSKEDALGSIRLNQNSHVAFIEKESIAALIEGLKLMKKELD